MIKAELIERMAKDAGITKVAAGKVYVESCLLHYPKQRLRAEFLQAHFGSAALNPTNPKRVEH